MLRAVSKVADDATLTLPTTAARSKKNQKIVNYSNCTIKSVGKLESMVSEIAKKMLCCEKDSERFL